MKDAISQLLQHGGAPLVVRTARGPLLIRVVVTRTSGGRRPDGLRQDAPADPGFGYSVAEALIEVDCAALGRNGIAAVHEVLWLAGTDDFMDYSHLHSAPAQIGERDVVRLTFSSAPKGAAVVQQLIEALESIGST